MLNFGRDPQRRPALHAPFAARLAFDPTVLQLLPLPSLRQEARTALTPATAKGERGAALLTASLLHAEIARRTGEMEALRLAVTHAQTCSLLGAASRSLSAAAALRLAEALALQGLLLSDRQADQAAESRLNGAVSSDAVLRARASALRIRLRLRAAIRALPPEQADQHASEALAAAQTLSDLAVEGRLDESEAVETRCDLADLLLVAGAWRKDAAPLERALALMNTASERADAPLRPLTAARVEILKGQLLAQLGDLAGRPDLIARGETVLRGVVDDLAPHDSPLDAARALHALAGAAQRLSEALEDSSFADKALDAFAAALSLLEDARQLPLRAVVRHDAALCLARRAERLGDLDALEVAEASFLDALRGETASDPLAWAVTQVALARVYEAQAELGGRRGSGGDAAFALASALEVFAERGLRSLSQTALSALERVRRSADG